MTAAIRTGHRHRADPRRVAGAASEQALVQHQTATDEEADVEVHEIGRTVARAKDKFGPAGRCCVILHIDRHVAENGQFGRDVTVAPGVQRAGRRRDMLDPVPKLERHGNAKAADSTALRHGQPGAERRQRIQNKAHDRFGRGVAIGLPPEADRLAQQIDQHKVNRAPPDLQPVEKGPIRRQRHRDRRLADAAPDRFTPAQKAIRLEPAHDDGDGLRGKPGHPGDIGFGQGAVPAHEGQHEAFVMGPHAALI